MPKRLVFLLVFCVTTVWCGAAAQTNDWTISITVLPAFEMPLDSGAASQRFDYGGSAASMLEISPPPVPWFNLFLRAGYQYAPYKAQSSLSLGTACLGAGLSFDVTPRLALIGSGGIGYNYGLVNRSGGESGGSLFALGGLGMELLLSPLFSVRLGAEYKNYVGLTDSIGVYVGASVFLTGRAAREVKIQNAQPIRPELLKEARTPEPGRGLRMERVSLEQVFPVFYAYYDDHPLGNLVISNAEPDAIQDVRLTVFIKQFMDAPKACPIAASIDPRARISVPLYALFTERALEITEGTKSTAEIVLEYKWKDIQYRDVKTETISFLDRNSMTWDDDRRASAFVTAKDPAVLDFAKNVVSMMRDAKLTSVDEKLFMAAALHSALDLHGISYISDPQSSYAENSRDRSKVDFLQFPRQTLSYRAGDCDDLSILYCALLESIGIETAFITVPGHIFMAFKPSLSAKEARRVLYQKDRLLEVGDELWIPVEITERKNGFMQAWSLGAREWREAQSSGAAGFFPLHEAWLSYKPVGLPGASPAIELPKTDLVMAAVRREREAFIHAELDAQVREIEAELSRNNTPVLRNRLGVLYARFGLYDKAATVFAAVTKQTEYAPALLNLGNLRFLEKDWENARSCYQRALASDPKNVQILVALVKTSIEMGDEAAAGGLLTRVKALDPGAAEKYAYLGSADKNAQKAANAGSEREIVTWQE